MTERRAVVIDYSGTLSLGSVLFGQSSVLAEELSRSGLAGFGVTTPGVFWNEIVGPTWDEASTTSVGYGNAIKRKIRDRSPWGANDAALGNAVSRFVESYLRQSSIDTRWAPVLAKLASIEYLSTVIATDHYAEATGHIARRLGEIGIPAVPCARPDVVPRERPPFMIANSADIGFHKANRRFWEAVRSGCIGGQVRKVALIDDFGRNEQEDDPYGVSDAVTARKERTVALVKEVFDVPVHVCFFGISGDESPAGQRRGRYECFGEWVVAAERFIDEFLDG